MDLHVPIGIDDFRDLRERGLAYVDKSFLIRELFDERGVLVALLPRPRRFGKSLNLSMLRAWFEKRDEDLSHLFQDLAIWQAGEAYRADFQRYPVILINLKSAKGDTWEECWATIRDKIAELYDKHRYVLDGGKLSDLQIRRYQQILDGTADLSLYERALLDLSSCLNSHHGERVVILIDEYDSPIHVAYVHGYAKKALDFMRGLLGNGLKTNPYLYRAVVTGILRIAEESLFSDVNNIGVFTLLATAFNTCFGFTEPEVASLLDRAGQADKLDLIRGWYNGYLFGGQVIYNPWSVLNFLQRREDDPAPYWLSTSSNDLVRDLLERYALKLQPVFESLLAGGSVERVLEENVVLSEITRDEDALWSLLVFSGYLKAEKRSQGPGERASHLLSIPNREVRHVYATTFRHWMRVRLEGHGGNLERLTSALLEGDAARLEEQLQAFVTNLLSYHDPGALDPEGVYHGFVLGLLAVMEPAYLVRSNRESGAGRPDVTIRSRDPGRPAAVMEMKVARKGRKTPAAALREGLSQIRDRRYEAHLLAAGASVVHAFAVAFDGKRVWVKSAGTPSEKTKPKGRSRSAAPRKAKRGSKPVAKTTTRARAKPRKR